jgi:hypothetical protein
MNRTLLLLFIFISIPGLKAQMLPQNGSVLNYRLVAFSIPHVQKVHQYCIEIADGFQDNHASFRKNIIKTVSGKTGRMIAEVPDFGKQYTWRYVDTDNYSVASYSEMFHFSTGSVTEVNPDIVRLRVIKKAEKYKDAYVFLDDNKVLYDMNGKAVWYLPRIPWLNPENVGLRDLKLTSFGTLTFLIKDVVYEVNYNGDVLWSAPKAEEVNDSSGQFHHEFTRLSNGHYMVLGTEKKAVLWQPPAPEAGCGIVLESYKRVQEDPGQQYRIIEFGTVIEYDGNGKEIWRWSSIKHFRESDLNCHRTKEGLPVNRLHENSFYFDEKRKIIYVGFKDISRIVKISYPDGAVLNSYGETFRPGVAEKGNGLFCMQHSGRLSKKGYLYLYNNNSCSLEQGALPSLVMMEEPTSKGGKLKKIWEYQCTAEGDDKMHYNFQVGGSVFELPDQSMFACMGGSYSKVFIVDMDKTIRWSAVPEKWSTADNKWMNVGQYRASIVTDRKALEKLIWNQGGVK